MSKLTIDRLIKGVQKYIDTPDKEPLRLNNKEVNSLLYRVKHDLERIQQFSLGEESDIAHPKKSQEVLRIHVSMPCDKTLSSHDITLAYDWMIGLSKPTRAAILIAIQRSLTEYGFTGLREGEFEMAGGE